MQGIEKYNNKLIDDIKKIVNQGRRTAYLAVDQSMVDTYWKIGRRIVEEEQQGQERAEYGMNIINILADELTHEYEVVSLPAIYELSDSSI